MADSLVVELGPFPNHYSGTSYASEFDSLQYPSLDPIYLSDQNDISVINIQSESFVSNLDFRLGLDNSSNFEFDFDTLQDFYLPQPPAPVTTAEAYSSISPEVSGEQCSNADKFLISYPSSESRNSKTEYYPANFDEGNSQGSGSGNFGSGVSESGHCDFTVDQKIKLEDEAVVKTCGPKRKKLSCGGAENNEEEEEEKKKARLMRNRESAQLSRQRKKFYVDELEDKVRTMHSTINDLNSKISYIMAENVNLRQQLSHGSGGGPPGMYPHPGSMAAPMGYHHLHHPWLPCAPYAVKPQGSQVPLVPIPRLKPQQPIPSATQKMKKNNNEGKSKTKKAASVSFLGLLLLILLFVGLLPIVNVEFGRRLRVRVSKGRVLRISNNGYSNGSKESMNSVGASGGQEFVRVSNNASKPLIASLYVPRNDRLVKIDGNLIIHSILASEKAMASQKASDVKNNRETALAILRGLKDHHKSPAPDGKLQQWLHEALAGPMLSSGTCTEVFQFDVPSRVVPTPAVSNASSSSSSTEHSKNGTTTHLNRGRKKRTRNRRRFPIPFGEPDYNVTKEESVGIRDPRMENFQGNTTNNTSVSSMVVSVLVDPREVNESEVDGMIAPKSLSRIFVVVLIDSVKYVTYSCRLPRSSPHLVAA